MKRLGLLGLVFALLAGPAFAQFHGGGGSSTVYNVLDYGADRTGVADSTAAINAAQTAAAVKCGIVFYPGGTYKVLTPITVAHCVTHEGVGWATTKDMLYTYDSGTQLIGNGTNALFIYNPTDASTPYATSAAMIADQISGVTIKDLAIANVTYGIKFGAKQKTGVFFSHLKNILVNQSSAWGLYLENCSYLMTDNLMVGNVPATAVGGIYVGASTYSAGVWEYNHGNHYMRGNSVFTMPYGSRGIVYQAREGASLNMVDSQWLGAGMSAGGIITQAATMTGGSADITVTDGTKYPLDMPVSICNSPCTDTSVTINGFKQYQTYFVVSQVGNVIRLANQQRGAAITATGASAINVFSYGFPGLEVSAFTDTNANATIQGTTLSGVSVDGQATTLVHSQNSYIYFDADFVAQNQGVSAGKTTASSLTFRNVYGGTFRVGHPVTVDTDNSQLGFQTTGFKISTTNPLSIIQKPPVGIWNDPAAGWRLNLQSGHNAKTGTLSARFGNNFVEMWTYPDTAIGQRTQFRADAPMTIDTRVAGAVVYTGAGSTTWTLPACTAAAGGAGNGVTGMIFYITNGSTAGGVLTLAAASGNTFNRDTTKTSYTINPYKSLGIIGQWDGSACFWQVISNDGAT